MIPVLLSIFLVAVLWTVVLFLKLPLALALAVIAAVVVAWVAFVAVRRWQAHRAAGEIDRALSAQAGARARSARPDEQGETQAMQAEFQKALQALKSSKLARGGRNALAILPWYLIIGPPGGGKSTALRASGLKFPYLSKRGGVRGVGGTRNCEWWLTNEAVLLDTAGRYTTEEEDHDEWMGFLEMLAKARPKKPVNGVIVAIPLADVAAESEEGAAELGRRLRERVDEVMSRLQMVLPVYVTFTKCDLLPGFVETFGNLPKSERGQVWGFTIPIGGEGEKGAAFSERFEELLGALEERSLRRLAEERQLAVRERVYEFPQQLEAGKATLAAFVDALFADNVYQDAPILRGVYFTSGTQEGRVIDRVMTSMAEAFGIRSALPAIEPVLEAKSYFLRDVFARVIFPDQHIAFRARGAQRRDAIRRWAAAGVAGALAAVVVVLLVRSFVLNRELLGSTGELVASAVEKLRSPGAGRAPLGTLELLRDRVALLNAYDADGPPWSMRFGLYRGTALLPRLRGLHAVAARRLLLDPAFRQDVADLEAFVRRFDGKEAAPTQDEHGRYYDSLKLHLLLTEPREPSQPASGQDQQAWIGRAIAERWSSRSGAVEDPAPLQLVQKNAELFACLLAGDPGQALPRHEELVRRARGILARLPPASLAVQKLVSDLDGKGYDVTLATLLHNAPVPALRSTGRVRGAFTRRAYEEVLRERLAKPAALVESWVVGDGTARQVRDEDEADRLRSRYYAQYIEEWWRFVDAIAVDRCSLQALPLLQDFTHGVPPPLALVFRSVGYNTRIAGPAGVLGGLRESILDKVQGAVMARGGEAARKALRKPEDREERRLGPADVEAAFSSFAGFGAAPDAGGPGAGPGGAPPPKLPIDAYLEQLAFVRDALQTKADGGEPSEAVGPVQQARARIQALITAQDVGSRPRFERLLWPPVEAALAEITDDSVKKIGAQWYATVVAPFREGIEGRYPFARDGEDAALLDVGAFFKPVTGTLWAFHDRMLKALVQPSGDGFEPARQAGGGNGLRPELLPFLRRARGITSALFPGGAGDLRVGFSVSVRPTPKIAIVALTVNGKRVEYFNGPQEWHRLTWPGDAGAGGTSLRVRAVDNREETIQRDGDWGLFRLLEAGALQGAPRSGSFAIAFKLANLGAVVTIDFRSEQAASPFVGSGTEAKLLEPVRAGPPIPSEIARKGGLACR